MKAFPNGPVLLCLALFGAVQQTAQAQIYKCKDATGSLLYTDSPCDADYDTVAIMPKGSISFEPPPLSDAAVAEELRLLSEQEHALLIELKEAQAASTASPRERIEASALKAQIQALLDSVRRQKAKLLGRGIAREEGEELVVETKH